VRWASFDAGGPIGAETIAKHCQSRGCPSAAIGGMPVGQVVDARIEAVNGAGRA